MTDPNALPSWYDEDISPANALTDTGVAILLGHTGTLRTTGEGDGDVNRVISRDGYDVAAGADTSAAGINPYLKPDLTTLPSGYVAAPVYDGSIY